MATLSILDASCLVYVGNKSKYYDRSFYGYRVGGIHYLLKYLCIGLRGHRDAIVIAFDSPESKRKEIWGKYKAGRVGDPYVAEQLGSLYQELQQCGICCCKVTGYEADDIVFWAIQEFLPEYDEIVIYSNDKDLTHNVQPKVRQRSVTLEMNGITYANFEKGIYRDVDLVFNTIAAYKIFCGCDSDGIPAMKNGKELYQSYCKFLRDNKITGYEATSSFSTLITFAKGYGFSVEELKSIATRIRLVYPMARPSGVVLRPTTKNGINADLFSLLLSKYNAVDALNHMKYAKKKVSEDTIAELRARVKYLASGEYCVDHDMPVESLHTSLDVQGMSLFEEEY